MARKPGGWQWLDTFSVLPQHKQDPTEMPPCSLPLLPGVDTVWPPLQSPVPGYWHPSSRAQPLQSLASVRPSQ